MSFLDNKIYYPMLLSEEGIEKERSSEEYKALWKKYLTLPLLSQNILTDDQLSLNIKNIQDTFHLNDIAIGNISLFIRKLFFGELTIEECEAKIGAMLVTTAGGDPNQAKAIATFIQKEILTIQPKPRAEDGEETEEVVPPKKMIANIPLLQALSKYENLGNQLISKERIKIKSQGESVRPSLLYWIKYYRDELGVGHHSSVDRGTFLFRSENGIKLSSEERERVNLILKSIEENLPLSIDTERQEIVFPEFQDVVVTDHKEQESGLQPKIPTAFNFATAQPTQRQTFQNTKNISSTKSAAPSSTMRIIENVHFEPPREDKKATPPEEGVMSFSSKHLFPAEKEGEKRMKNAPENSAAKQEPAVPIAVPEKMPPAPPKNKRSPANLFIIHPTNLGRDNEEEENDDKW